jgi:hypothetical protein
MMRKTGMVALALLGVAGAVRTDAAVLCQKKSGAVFVREACRKKEKLLDAPALAALGLQGPMGLQGSAGTARAYACAVSYDGTTVSFCPGRPSKNVTSVVANTSYPGYTCFVIDPSIDVGSATVIASLNSGSGYSGGKINALIWADGFSNYTGCPPNSVLVVTARHTNDGAFLGLEAVILSVSIAVM